MPLGGIPAKEYLNREEELAYLGRLAEFRRDRLAANVLLTGGRGAGKTELLKQLHSRLFWAGREVVPFYYSFRTAALKGTVFAQDYYTRFVKQYAAFMKKEPLLAGNAGMPLERLAPELSALGLGWMIDGLDDFRSHIRADDLYGQILSAVSAPAEAAVRGGRPVVVMLDDFTAAGNLHESRRGDSPGLVSLFEESMRQTLCPHIITGGPPALLEGIFSDPSLHKNAGRMRLGPLPEDTARAMLLSLFEKVRITCEGEEASALMRKVRGNPMYIRNIAKAAWKMKKGHLSARDLMECYLTEVMDGETAFYWSAVLGECLKDSATRNTVLRLLLHRIERCGTESADRLSQVIGVREADLGSALDILSDHGLGQGGDPVFEDFLRALHMREIGGKTSEQIRERLEEGYGAAAQDAAVFEMVIPMTGQAELVAARAVDQIGRNVDLDPDFMQYIQLALVECCINAIEHSGSHERKIHIKCLASPRELEIMIETPGRHFSFDGLQERTPEQKLDAGQKRGWGLSIMRKILDEVRVERIHDRTRVTLIKKINPDSARGGGGHAEKAHK